MPDFNNYIQNLRENIQHGGECSHYPSLKCLIEGLMIGVNAKYQIQKTPKGYGIIGFITNHSYLNGLIHRGMREELLKYFDTL
ncbi:hypothetical protein [Dolichospermum sp. UHCC 0259]|uniref:hypothetical protein n=1 Tax=Dolichospermum sp. UHCC 0259 TaxID=2590010 RepID=UPI001445025E|nr:hypothetical protein [Dolichospermum sp. UHCC 0259]MTJ48360.1 hypothetical protein [Dolichospermum sp. UHCC 0259]